MLDRLVRWGPPLALVKARGVASECDGADAVVPYGSGESVTVPESPVPGSYPPGRTYDVPRPYVCAYDEARLVGEDDPVALTADGRPVLDVARNHRFDVLRQVRGAAADVGWGATLAEAFAPSLSGGAGGTHLETVVPFTRQKPEMGYYHWLTEYLPRVRGVEAYARDVGEYPTVLVESDPPAWIEQSLDLVGVPRSARVEWRSGRATVDRLVVPRYARAALPEPFAPSRADLAWVRDTVRRTVSNAPGDAGTRVFVSRADADERRLDNRERVEQLVAEYGFDVVVPAEHDVTEQVSLFRSAEVVLGPHGAGLTNALFSDRTTLVELVPRNYTPAYFHVLAALFDLEYEYVLGSDADPDFAVPIDRVRDVLERLC